MKLKILFNELIRRMNKVSRLNKNVFYVPIKNCLISMGGLVSFSLKNFNPYVEQVKQFKRKKDMKYQDSLIKKMRSNIVSLIKKSKFEKNFFGDRDIYLSEYVPDSLKNQLDNFDNLTCIPYRGWIQADKKEIKKEKYFHGYHFEKDFYPKKKDFYSLLNLFSKIKKEGYKFGRNSTINSSFIQGVILKDNWEFKVHICSGRRRAAVLAALGWSEIPVVLYDNRVSMNKLSVSNKHQLLDTKNIEDWIVVKKNIYPEDMAKKLFNLRFRPKEEEKKKLLLNE
ncbi:hypothetical protein [Halarsenatibacter silvermanii]|uniref:Uncharacterized protein n=1 Tax=Halarsenatibacter silvermanii TaxID=321763 RepID=A0A1G9HYY1_9FIRM|nr:hypothetical protein [Halarsenatibacter silvermanii]SDL18207.1 hypothetical protein SAMN04488692_10271 [Halarsenatibacter silvermanii]